MPKAEEVCMELCKAAACRVEKRCKPRNKLHVRITMRAFRKDGSVSIEYYYLLLDQVVSG